MEETFVKIYITKLNGMHAQSTEQFVQHGTADIAHSLGIREMGIYRYNAADERSDITLWELANVIAAKAGTSVCYELPEESERKGYSTATKALLDGNKLKKLGWKAQHDLTMGIEETIRILRETTF